MKASIRNLTLFMLALVAFNQAVAQKASFTTNGGMTIGFGLGGSYQQSDIRNSRGAGFDFTLGSHIYKKENAFFAVDWKFRFLAGENRAHDHRINADTTFSNIKYDLFNYDLEIGLTLNRLREQTRIIITGFAGAGITHGRTFTDLYNENGQLYDYTVINPNQEKASLYADLLELTDGDFETALVNRAAVMPTLGIFIGYQFSRSFSMGIEHKTTFSLNEYNSFAGIDIDNNVLTGSRRDMNHYTSLGFKWSLGGGSSRSKVRSNYSTITTPTTTTRPANQRRPVTNPTQAITVTLPVVDITVPVGNTYSTSARTVGISARVLNVRSQQEVQVQFNGRNITFEFNPGSGNVKATLLLGDGTNNLVITGTNQAGSARDNVTIFYNKPVRLDPPVIRFINPASPVTVDNNIFGIRAQTEYVKDWQDITVKVNGISASNFSFSNEGLVTINIGLKEGSNRVEISGKNESGVATERATITYNRPVKAVPPVVKILIPDASPINTYESSQEIRANITGVTGRENISLAINGIYTTNFDYDNSSLVLNSSVSLNEGRNVIKITARNEAGQDVETKVVIKETMLCPAPVLRMVAPAQNGLTSDNLSYTFRTEVKNIGSRDQLILTLNERSITNFNFTGNEVILPASLNVGSNNFLLIANNECGTQRITSSIIYRPAQVVVVVPKPCPKPGLNFSVAAINENDATHELKGFITNAADRSEVKITINGSPYEGFQFVPATGELSASFKFNPGSHTIVVNVTNECGSISKNSVVTVEQPCVPPQVNFTITTVNRADATHELKGFITNAAGRSEVKITINGSPYEGFQFVPATGELSASFKFNPGSHTIVVNVTNECGSNSKNSVVTVEQPCVPPQVNFTITTVNRDDATHELKGSVSSVQNRNEVKITVNGSPYGEFQFVPATGELSASFKFNPGNHTIIVSVSNECGSDSKNTSVTVEQPCMPPQLSFNVTEVNRADASHELKGSMTNIKIRSEIKITVNGSPYDGFQFVPATGELSARFKFNPGTHNIIVNVSNECGQNSSSKTVVINEEKPCGIRINPGNSAWQFCLVTPSGTYNRENLTNSNFSYSGPASSLFFKPIAGGGDANVNRKPYSVRAGQYYLFTGNLRVTVSTKNPGSMGQWSVCITTDKVPQSGNGNNRPKSPCEEVLDNSKPKKKGTRQ